MRNLKLMADYGCWPLWAMAPDEPRNIDPAELPISESLRESLYAWAQTYDATLNEDYPPDSGFPSEDAEQEFDRQGRELRARLQEELGDQATVRYFSVVTNDFVDA